MDPVYGTYERTYYEWLNRLPKSNQIGYFCEGKMYTGADSAHLSTAACRLRKLKKINSGHRWKE